MNQIDCGLAWAPPYRVEITNALRSGANVIEIIVYNTAANALAADQHMTRLAAETEARYGRRFRLQDLDKAMDTVRSGLLHGADSRSAKCGLRAFDKLRARSQDFGQERPGFVLHGRVEDVTSWAERPAVTPRTRVPAT